MLTGETAVTKNNDEKNLHEEQYQSKYNVMQVFSCDKESLLERYSIKSPKIHYTLTYNHRN
jgi:Ulp1 family protease